MNPTLVLLLLISTEQAFAAPAFTSFSQDTPSSLPPVKEISSFGSDTASFISSVTVNTARRTTIQVTPTQVKPSVSSVSLESATSASSVRTTRSHSTARHYHTSVSSAMRTISRQQSKSIFREASTSQPTHISSQLSTTTTSLSASNTPTPHLGPGIVLPPASVTSVLPTLTSSPFDEPEDDTHDALLHGAQFSQPSDTPDDPHPFQAPIHKLIVLSMVFLGFVGLSCGFLVLSSSKAIRSYLCCSLKQKKPSSSEKLQPMTLPKNTPLPAVSSPRWLKLPTQIIGSPTSPLPRSSIHGRIRNRVIDITPNFPRSRFSDSSSEGSASIYSDSDSLDGTAPNEKEEEATTIVIHPSELFSHGSDISAPVNNTSRGSGQQYLTVPRRMDERWSLEAQRLSSFSEAASSLRDSVQGSEDRWSVDPQRISAVSVVSNVSEATSVRSDDRLLAMPRRLLEAIRWSLDPQRL